MQANGAMTALVSNAVSLVYVIIIEGNVSNVRKPHHFTLLWYYYNFFIFMGQEVCSRVTCK